MIRGIRSISFAAATVALALATGSGAVRAEDKFRIGVLNDHYGPYADFSGLSTVEAAKMAVEDFGGTVLGKPIEVLAGDHENKKDKGVAIVTEWFEKQNVSAIADMTNSGVALAVQDVAKGKGKIALFSGPASTALTGKACSPTGMHWTFDAYSQAVGTARGLVKEGKDTWFIIAVDDAFGQAMDAEISKAVEGAGGKVVGRVRHPLNEADLSDQLVKAQGSGAKVIALANAGNDTINAIKQASLVGVAGGSQVLAGMVVVISDINNIGLEDAKGLSYLEGFYWDRDDESRAFSKRFMARTGRMPGMVQAGVYSAVLHYLKAVKEVGADDGAAVAKKMKEMPVNDSFAKNGKVREDGRMVHDMYLVSVKKPAESKGAWDYLKVLRTVPADQAFRPLAESECPLVKK
ncbi:MAG TPA: ABC transporter substrate-binding protein [Magnetospirillum sp.]|nr:ABC transporter substrate-binding protein [Magnetospirillum sp.]